LVSRVKERKELKGEGLRKDSRAKTAKDAKIR